MAYYISGTHLINACEYASESDARTEASLSTSAKYTWGGGYTFKSYYGVKLISYSGGYLYSKDAIGGRYRTGNSSYTVSAKGHRPLPTILRYTTTTPTLMYLNKFDNGDCYISSERGTKTGAYLGTFHYMFGEIIGGGGGSGSSTGSSSSGGGGGGGYVWFCFPTGLSTANQNMSFKVGAGGSGNADGTDTGHPGGGSYFGYTDWSPGYESFTWRLIAGGGNAGNAGNSSGGGGSGGSVSVADRNTGYGAVNVIYSSDGKSGGAKNNAGTGTPSLSIGGYNPEGLRQELSSQSGGSGPYGGGGGGGWRGAGGNGGGAYENGHNGGIGGGGGGAAYVWFSSRNGGTGGNGSIRLYY